MATNAQDDVTVMDVTDGKALPKKRAARRKTMDRDLRHVGVIIDVTLLQDRNIDDAAEEMLRLKQDYKLGRIALLYDSKYDNKKDVKALSQAIADKIGQEVPVISYPEGIATTTTYLKDLTFQVNRTSFSHRRKTQIHFGDFDGEENMQNFRNSGFELCVSKDLDDVRKKVSMHVENIKNGLGFSLD